MIMKFLFGLLSILLINKECSSAQNNLKSTKQQESLNGIYTIAEVDNAKLDRKAITISFNSETKTISGFSGCNRFSGKYNVDGDAIKLSDIVSTEKLCLNKESSIEKNILKALNSASKFQIKDNTLSLLSKDKVVLKTESISDLKSKPFNKADLIGNHYKTKTVTYTALSRGFYRHISVTEGKLMVSENQSLKPMATTILKTEDWKSIDDMISKIDVKTLQRLKPPSTNHTFDGAPHATLSLRNGDLEVMSPTFDHGNPPKELKPLVNKLLSLAKID